MRDLFPAGERGPSADGGVPAYSKRFVCRERNFSNRRWLDGPLRGEGIKINGVIVRLAPEAKRHLELHFLGEAELKPKSSAAHDVLRIVEQVRAIDRQIGLDVAAERDRGERDLRADVVEARIDCPDCNGEIQSSAWAALVGMIIVDSAPRACRSPSREGIAPTWVVSLLHSRRPGRRR